MRLGLHPHKPENARTWSKKIGAWREFSQIDGDSRDDTRRQRGGVVEFASQKRNGAATRTSARSAMLDVGWRAECPGPVPCGRGLSACNPKAGWHRVGFGRLPVCHRFQLVVKRLNHPAIELALAGLLARGFSPQLLPRRNQIIAPAAQRLLPAHDVLFDERCTRTPKAGCPFRADGER